MMKKLTVLFLSAVLFCSCEMYKTQDVIVVNNSAQNATLYVKNVKEGSKMLLGTSMNIAAGETLSFPLYLDGNVSLQSVGRNLLKKHSDTRYEILNATPVFFTVYNKTTDSIIIKDLNNLFDTKTIATNTNTNVSIYNHEKIQPVAIANGTNLVLRVSIAIPTRTMVVSY